MVNDQAAQASMTHCRASMTRLVDPKEETAQRLLTEQLNRCFDEGWTTKRLGLRIGVPFDTLRNWRTGHRRPPAWLALWIVDRLSCVWFTRGNE